MKQVNTKLMNQIDLIKIQFKLNQLVQYYGLTPVDNEVIFSQSGDNELKRHIDNLLLTYSVSFVYNVWDNMSKQLKKVG